MPKKKETDTQITADSYVNVAEWFTDLQYKEVHLFTLGFYSGFVAIRPKARQAPNVKGAKADQWYWKGGYVLGYIIKALIVGSMGAKEVLKYLPF